MGVYIKGMDMPKSCCDCDIGVCICNRYYDPNFDINDTKIKRHPDCPLVEVKEPHGDLVDRAKLAHDMEFVMNDENCPLYIAAEIDQYIEQAPMVIEAEG